MESSYTPALRTRYQKDAVPALMKEFQYGNPMEVPRLEKIVVNMGLGAAIENNKIIETGVEDLKAITGQKPVITRAKKAIATFKLRENLPIGVMVTFALPRVRDFKGVSPKAFDGRGNYTLGVREQIIFPEIDYDKIDKIKGMNISIVTTAKNDEQGRALLRALGMPFRK
jgi:large subunit ribosomal protein L5